MKLAILLAFLVLPTDAIAREAYEVKTPSGAAEAIFIGKNAADVKASIASACLDFGWGVTANTDGMVTCTHRNIGTTAILLCQEGPHSKGLLTS